MSSQAFKGIKSLLLYLIQNIFLKFLSFLLTVSETKEIMQEIFVCCVQDISNFQDSSISLCLCHAIFL